TPPSASCPKTSPPPRGSDCSASWLRSSGSTVGCCVGRGRCELSSSGVSPRIYFPCFVASHHAKFSKNRTNSRSSRHILVVARTPALLEQRAHRRLVVRVRVLADVCTEERPAEWRGGMLVVADADVGARIQQQTSKRRTPANRCVMERRGAHRIG